MKSSDPLVQLRQRLAQYEPLDLAAGVGGLQLMPENADRLIRLEAAANVIVSVAPAGGAGKMTAHRWGSLLAGPVLGSPYLVAQEDPFDSPFADSVSFFGGAFVVLPGLVEEAAFIVEHLLTAIFLDLEPFPDSVFAERASQLAGAILRLGDAVAARASLGRGQSPESAPRRPVVLPNRERFDSLKTAVSFTEDEFVSLCRDGLEEIRSLVAEWPTYPEEIDLLDSDRALTPVMFREERFVAAYPCAMLATLRHRLITMAQEHGVTEELARRYREAVFRTARRSLGYLESVELDVPLPPIDGLSASQGLFSFDADKAIHLVLVTDDLEDYSERHLFGSWKDDALGDKIEKHVTAVQQEIPRRSSRPDGILHLVLIQGVGRRAFAGFSWRGDSDRRYLNMSAADLETIAYVEGGESLVLWKYSGAASRFRDQARVFGFGSLDEFQLYREHGYSYYLSDDRPPTFLNIVPGYSKAIRMEVANKIDRHGALGPHEDSIVEVVLLFGDRNVPIYMLHPDGGRHAALLVEGLDLPVWVLAPEATGERRLASLHRQLIEAVAYWVWQSTAIVQVHARRLRTVASRIRIQVEITSGDDWLATSEDESDGPYAEFDVSSHDSMTLRFHSGLRNILQRPDNEGEFELIRATLLGMRELVKRHFGVEGLPTEGELLRYGRDVLGPPEKKKLLFLSTETQPELTPGAVAYRGLQAHDVEELLNELGRHLVFPVRASRGPD